MFDANQFKRSVKEWIRANPEGTEADLVDFCEEQIPTALYSANHWLVEHTLSWFRHIMVQRQHARELSDDSEDAVI